MSKIVIFSAARADAVANIQHSVVEGVGLDVLGDSRMLAELESHRENGRIRLWGIQPGGRGNKITSWRRLEPPTVAFFYTGGAFRYTATMWAKEPPSSDGAEGNPPLSQAVWGDSAFELIGFLEDVRSVDVATYELKSALGYERGYALGRESVVPNEQIQDAVIARFGSAEAFRQAVEGHVGTPPLDQLPASRLPADSLGTAYRRQDEGAKAERNEVYRVDPDKIDRGTQAHKRTQNLLAEHLESRELRPKAPQGSEPPYDLAWEDGGTIYLAEIKSLTHDNEERQLRLALGQILRYGQQLARVKRRPIQKVITVERAPTDSSWTDLCAGYDIALVWPESFGQLNPGPK